MSLNRAFVAGVTVATAADWNGLQAAGTAYTPAWTTSAGAPSVGDGSLIGKVLQVGKWFDFTIELVVGSTTTFGTAGSNWRFTLPLPLLSTRRRRFLASAVDNGVADYTAYARYVAAGPYLEMVLPTGAGGADVLLTNTVPFTWNNGDSLIINGRAETS